MEDTEVIQETNSEFIELMAKYNNDISLATFEYCYKHNIYYNEDIINLLSSMTDYDLYITAYVDTLEADATIMDKTFLGQISPGLLKQKVVVDEYIFSEDDKKNRQQCIDTLQYDPFVDEKSSETRAQLYRDLAGMLSENMRKDIAKQKAALSVVRSYSNIEKYQKKVNELMCEGNADEDTQDSINNYLKLISTIQTSINQTAEKNNFTVKGIGSNGRGMLSDVMNQIEDRGIDSGITNFYDIETSNSIEEIANISWKSMLNQVNLSKTDYADIITDQAELVRKAQLLAAQSSEALRLAKEKITKQSLLEELERDYKRKGISEEDINEFISREIHMFDIHE